MKSCQCVSVWFVATHPYVLYSSSSVVITLELLHDAVLTVLFRFHSL